MYAISPPRPADLEFETRFSAVLHGEWINEETGEPEGEDEGSESDSDDEEEREARERRNEEEKQRRTRK